MASIREQIVQQVVTLLGAVGKPAGLNVHRSRTLPIEKDQLPALVVYLKAEESKRKGGEWQPLAEDALLLCVECRASGNPPDQMLDPLLTWATKQLVANQTLGGLARSVERMGAAWDAADGDRIYAGAAVHFTITYQSAAADPEAQ